MGDMVNIKGTRNGLVIVLDPSREFEEIKHTLLRKMESAKGFFKGAQFSFLAGQGDISAHQKNELENICRQYGLVPNAEERVRSRNGFSDGSRRKALSPSRSAATDEAALMVRRSLRSGQCITYPRHVVVLGDIHPGAEVVSGGDVLVLGSCRGVIHAGAGGDHAAKVIARRLAPTVLTIAGRRCPPEVTAHIPAGCQVARLSDQKIVFEDYQTGR